MVWRDVSGDERQRRNVKNLKGLRRRKGVS